MYIESHVLGKSCPSSKAKNSKAKLGEKPSTKSKPKSSRRMSDLFGDESEDKSLGQERESSINTCSQFSSVYNDNIRAFVKPSELIPKEMSSLCSNLENLLMYSASKSTWNKHCSAWKLYENFCNNFTVSFTVPISPEYARAFATWGVTKKGLKSSTIISYISSLNVAHTLANTPNGNLNSDPCIKMVLKGASNVSCLSEPAKPDRLPMNIHLLEILSHRLTELSWSDFSKQIFWTACTLCFFTACRMGELVPTSENSFDPATTLTWDNVKFLENKEALIFIPY